MHCLVVKAHPLSESLCTTLADRIAAALQAGGHEVVLENLYAEHFNAAMTPDERSSYYQESYAADRVRAQVNRLLAAQAVVLVFPTWWFSYPAILKGWFDRVWAPGVAYDHAEDFGPIRPRLHNLREMLVVTSLGAPWWVDWILMQRPVNKVLKNAIVRACAPKCHLRVLSLYKAEQLTGVQVERFWMRVEKTLSKW